MAVQCCGPLPSPPPRIHSIKQAKAIEDRSAEGSQLKMALRDEDPPHWVSGSGRTVSLLPTTPQSCTLPTHSTAGRCQGSSRYFEMEVLPTEPPCCALRALPADGGICEACILSSAMVTLATPTYNTEMNSLLAKRRRKMEQRMMTLQGAGKKQHGWDCPGLDIGHSAAPPPREELSVLTGLKP